MALPPLCDTFRRQAGSVWNRTRNAAALQLFMSEETLTETVLFEVARRHQAGDFVVIPATKPQEFVHGADWVFWFVSGGKGISYRVQAKKLFSDGRYRSLLKSGKDSHGNPIDPEEQLKKLISKADADGHIPLYCFYNFAHPHGNFYQYGGQCAHSYRAPSFWGCSIALAQDVQLAKSDELKDLRKYMVPWHLLACTADAKTLAESAISAARTLAEPKGSPRVVAGIVTWERPKREIEVSLRDVPSYIHEMIEIRESHGVTPSSHLRARDEIESRARGVLDEQELAGIAVFEDIRGREPKVPTEDETDS